MSGSRASSKGRQAANSQTRKNGSQPGRGASATGTQAAEAEPPLIGRRRFLPTPRTMGGAQFTAFVLSVCGLIDAAYQVYTHFAGTGLLACSGNGDPCVLVQSSVYAWVFGIPVAVYGAAFFVFMVVACSPWAWRFQQSDPRYGPMLSRARLGAVVVGMIFVLYLIYRELVSIGQICPYCTSVHVLTVLLFCVLVYQAAGPGNTATVR